jgi:hypothetical protein
LATPEPQWFCARRRLRREIPALGSVELPADEDGEVISSQRPDTSPRAAEVELGELAAVVLVRGRRIMAVERR